MHCEGTSDTDVGEFCNALALLRSTEEDSAEKLRRMLDACIEKRYGPGRTLAARMPKRFLQDADERPVAPAVTPKRRVRGQSATKNQVWDGSQQIADSLSRTDDIADRSTTIDVEVLEVGYMNCYDDEDIPRISIPDEGPTDTTVCKVSLN